MDRPKLEVADVFRHYGEAYRQEHGASLSTAQRRVMTAIEVCRTAVLGGHLEQCDHCGHQRNAYNSCADRHCPKCQSLARAPYLGFQSAPSPPPALCGPWRRSGCGWQSMDCLPGWVFLVRAGTLKAVSSSVPGKIGQRV